MVDELLTTYGLVEEVPSCYLGSPYQTCYLFRNILTIQPLVVYWRLIIMINRTILRIKNLSPEFVLELEHSPLDAAHHIGMSIENGRRWKPCGYWLLAFSLPAALWAYSNCESAEMEYTKEAEWIQRLLYRFVNSMETAYATIFERYWGVLRMDYSDFAEFDESGDRRWSLTSIESPDSE